jgi:hypothetical protein
VQALFWGRPTSAGPLINSSLAAPVNAPSAGASLFPRGWSTGGDPDEMRLSLPTPSRVQFLDLGPDYEEVRKRNLTPAPWALAGGYLINSALVN